MPIPVQFLGRLAIPLVVATYFMGDVPGQMQFFDQMLTFSDKTLSQARGEGSATEFFHYIVVGSGSAGAVVANRLSASREYSVLLLEAGGDPNPVSDIPYTVWNLWNSPMDYNYTTVRQERSCLFYNNGICLWPRGKALGGTSQICGLVYNRGNAKDYDNWANFTGDPTWRFENVLDAFKTIEDYHGFYEDNPGPNHGRGGEMHISKISYLPSVEFFFKSLAEKGIPEGDLNSGLFPYGFSKVDYSIKNGLRHGTYQAFLEPILNRPNLIIYRYAQVTKIHFDGSQRTTGVTYQRHGVSHLAGAIKEVIVSAGVVDSPKLLMLSGIGPRAHLEQLGIETKVDLPAVGQHMQDHVGVEINSFYLNKTFGVVEIIPETVNEFIQNQTGPATNAWDPIANGYINSRNNDYNDPSWPDIYIYITEGLINPNTNNEVDSLSFGVKLARSNSLQGSVRLASKNPDDHPLIDPNFFEDPAEVDRIIDGIDFMMDVFLNTSAYQSIGIQFSDTVHPIDQCKSLEFPSREYWRCYMPYGSGSYNHPTSTCRMGPNNSGAVVDSKLRVFGTTGLRVIDSSIMPFVPSGNTNFPTIMIGEMGSRMILDSVNG